MYRDERNPFDLDRLREWSGPTRLDGLARSRREVPRVGATQPLPAPPDTAAFDEPEPRRKVRLPRALGGGTAVVVRWRADGDRLILTRPGMREPFEVSVADVEQPLRRRRRWLLRRR